MFRSPRWYVPSLLVLCILAFSGLLLATHSWGGYHWARATNPVTIATGDNVTATWDPYLDEAIVDWNSSTVVQLNKVTGGTTPRKCRPTAGRIEVCNAAYGKNGWLGLASIWISSGTHISQATTKLNDSYFNTAQYNTPAWRHLVTCQEVAHDFGLDHQDEAFGPPNLGSCMDYTNDPDGGGAYGPSNEHPNAHDYEELEIIYGHIDSGALAQVAVKRMPPAMRDLDFNDPKNWGRLVRGSRAQGHSTYVQDFGHGNKVVTHVFWVRDSHRPE